MKLDPIKKAYCCILLEEILTDESTLRRIDALPPPLNLYFTNMREAMLEAENADTEEDRIAVNSKVNVWRDKIVDYWIKNSKKMKVTVVNEVNDILMMIVERYTELMGGCNTGYSNAG